MSPWFSHCCVAIVSVACTALFINNSQKATPSIQTSSTLHPDQVTPASSTLPATSRSETPGQAGDADQPPSDSAKTLQECQHSLISLEQEITELYNTLNAIEEKPQQRPIQERWFDEKKLMVLGVNEQRIKDLKTELEAMELKKLQLRQLATREGWHRSSRLRRSLAEIEQQSRDKLSDEDYDLLLYASGKNNRLRITDTLSQGVAAAAGLQRNDIIYSYNNQRIFSMEAFNQLIRNGKRGELVELSVERNGSIMTVYLPRGALGIRFLPGSHIPKL